MASAPLKGRLQVLSPVAFLALVYNDWKVTVALMWAKDSATSLVAFVLEGPIGEVAYKQAEALVDIFEENELAALHDKLV